MTSRDIAKATTRTKILDAAREVIAVQGLTQTTARDIARAAHVAVGTVFLHFPTMARLAETLLDDIVAAALRDADLDQPDGFIARLVHIAQHLYDAYDTDAELSRQVIGASLFEVSEGSPSHVQLASFRRHVTRAVEDAVAAGEIRPIDPNVAFLGYFSLYFGVLVDSLRGELPREARGTVLRELLERLFQKGR